MLFTCCSEKKEICEHEHDSTSDDDHYLLEKEEIAAAQETHEDQKLMTWGHVTRTSTPLILSITRQRSAVVSLFGRSKCIRDTYS